MDSRLDLLGVGETMLLLVPDPPVPPAQARSFRREVGGAESNVAIHLARLGRRAGWASALGDDTFGGVVREELAAAGVLVDARRVADRPTGLYLKERRPEGTTVVYYRDSSAATTLGPDDAARILARPPRILHTTGITAAISASADELVTLLLAPAAGLRSFDVNYRPAVHERRGMPERLRAHAARADIVFVGLDEAAALWGLRDPSEVRALLPEVELLVVKLGADGAVAFHAGRSVHQPPPQVVVREPVGAGDAFAGGVLDGVLDGALDGESGRDSIDRALARGAALAGATLEVDGDLPPLGEHYLREHAPVGRER